MVNTLMHGHPPLIFFLLGDLQGYKVIDGKE